MHEYQPEIVDKDVLASRIRTLVAESGKSNSQFAKYMGVSYYSLNRWVQGYTTPKQEALVRLSRKCNAPMDWILGVSDERYEEGF